MDSIVETQRQTHEELERYEQALADVLMQNPTVVSEPAEYAKSQVAHNLSNAT
jgi:hypothetical protein